jgi:hypothetical protein
VQPRRELARHRVLRALDERLRLAAPAFVLQPASGGGTREAVVGQRAHGRLWSKAARHQAPVPGRPRAPWRGAIGHALCSTAIATG